MRKMKDSGIEWLGDIPESWAIQRIKYLARCNAETLSDKTPGDYEFDYIDISSVGQGVILGSRHFSFRDAPSRARRIIRENDVIISTVRTYLKAVSKVSKAEDGMVVSTGFAVLKPAAIDADFFSYVLQSHGFVSEVQRFSYGMSYPAINASKLVNLKIPVPPPDEQQRIASFLNAKCAEIDRAIDAAEKSIEEYKAYRNSVIFQAVTKGLDPDVPTKDSGVEWLGKVPVGWQVRYPKFLFAARKERARDDDVMLTASQHHGMIPQQKFMERESYTPVVVEKGHDILKHVEPGDFVISMRSFQGGLEYSPIRGKMSSAYLALYPVSKETNSDYYRWLFKCQGYIQALQTTTNLVRDGQALRYSNFLKVWIPVPPVDEQAHIADYLDAKCAEIDRAINGKQSIIEDLKAYKQSLIYEVVTGKKEV